MRFAGKSPLQASFCIGFLTFLLLKLLTEDADIDEVGVFRGQDNGGCRFFWFARNLLTRLAVICGNLPTIVMAYWAVMLALADCGDAHGSQAPKPSLRIHFYFRDPISFYV